MKLPVTLAPQFDVEVDESRKRLSGVDWETPMPSRGRLGLMMMVMVMMMNTCNIYVVIKSI